MKVQWEWYSDQTGTWNSLDHEPSEREKNNYRAVRGIVYVEEVKALGAQLAAVELEAFAAKERAYLLEKDKLEFQLRIKLLEHQLAGMRERLEMLAARHEWITEPRVRNWKDVVQVMSAEAALALSTPASEWERRVQGLVEAVRKAVPHFPQNLDTYDAYFSLKEALAAWEGK